MENKLQTLQVIYELVKNDNRPSMTNIRANEIVARHHFPWDEIVLHLQELKQDGFILMTQLSTAVISITEKGFDFAASSRMAIAS